MTANNARYSRGDKLLHLQCFQLRVDCLFKSKFLYFNVLRNQTGYSITGATASCNVSMYIDHMNKPNNEGFSKVPNNVYNGRQETKFANFVMINPLISSVHYAPLIYCGCGKGCGNK